jgi:hypothetical protein
MKSMHRNDLSGKNRIKTRIFQKPITPPTITPKPQVISEVKKPERVEIIPPSTNDRISRLDIVLTCVNYSDYLVVALMENIKHINPKFITVVTDSKDELTKRVCDVFGVNCVVTDVFYAGGAAFNKGRAINEGIKSLKNPEWILLTDADIVFPDKFLDDLNKRKYDSNKLYAASRYTCNTYNKFLKYRSENIELTEMDTLNRCTPVGYFQLFSINHYSITNRNKVYPEKSDDASWSDMLFSDKFPQKECLDWIKLVHLGIDSRNWKGRKTVRFIDDELLTKLIEDRFNSPFIPSPRKTKNTNKLAVLTSFFNPANYNNIKNNYTQFKSFMKESGVDLFTAELVFGDREFFTEESDYNVHIRGGNNNIMWQKERLLNLLLDKLPPEYNNVAWIDCDVLFENKNWVSDANDMLQKYKLVQLFEYVQFFNENGVVNKNAIGIVKHLHNTKDIPNVSFDQRVGGHPGMAWAIRREDIKTLKFNDFQIIGGADSIMMAASVGVLDNAYLYTQMNPKWYSQTLIWSVNFSNQINKSLFYIPGSVYHLYHGTNNNRKYSTRWAYLRDNEYTPRTDIVLNNDGVWEWATDKPDMHKKVKNYFFDRHEDDNVKTLNHYFDGIFCINLERRKDRWDVVSKRFKDNDILVERVVAYDGNWELVKNEWNPIYNSLAIKYGEKFTKNPSEVGFIENSFAYATLCTHIKIIQIAKQRGLKKILIFEDDVVFHKEFKNRIKEIGKIPNWKLLYLGASQYDWSSVKIENRYYHPKKALGGFAYGVDSSVFDEILSLATKHEKSFDNCLGDYSGNDIQSKYKNNCYVLYPNLVIADVRDSDLRESRQIDEHSEKMKWVNQDYNY